MEAASTGKPKIYAAGFREEWKEKFPRLSNDKSNGKKCTICNIGIVGGLSHIQRHASRECHIKKLQIAKNTPKINTFLESTRFVNNDLAKKLEIILCFFVAEHNLPFTILDHLNNIIKDGIANNKKVFN
ncbi:hypothetical protein FF38_07894 [Lucilia cuprina]|uniref:Uncharacterized protein n=1 Tax=Lucilia cuprina TaxID=7375 RepID=A0A0L0CPB5_LUCCU|nr:hypothetical protein FF38_07894 [Lucilia cuprina]